DLNCEVAIIGAGISGVATLYYLMTRTQKKVVLLEKERVASGATGYNAGLAVVHIEKPVSELIDMLGKEATQVIFSELDDAWDDIQTRHREIGLQDNLLSFLHVVNGFSSFFIFISFIMDVLILNDISQIHSRHL